MSIEKKPIETLKQQKESFLNYIKTKEKYSWIIADLFEDDEIEKIDNMEWVKKHLEQKWISKELADTLEEEYTEYLRWGSYYWPTEEYPEELKETIKKNNEILRIKKKNILIRNKEYENLLWVDIKKFVNKTFIDQWHYKNTYDEKYWNQKIWDENKKITKKNEKIEEYKRKIKISNDSLENMNWFMKRGKKKALENEIAAREAEIQKLENEKNEIQKLIYEYDNNIKLVKKIEGIKKRDESYIETIVERFKEKNNLELYKEVVETINSELKGFLKYITKEEKQKIKRNIINVLNKHNEKAKENIKNKIENEIKEYISFFNYWENNDLKSIKTIYSRNRLDPRIMQIINNLWINVDVDWSRETIDYNFINDVFIHTTNFDILDEILDEWWLISSCETQIRAKDNEDIKNSMTQWYKKHKDVYFSRWYRKNFYWHAKSDDDHVYIVNTMKNFANSWYWVPLNTEMQSFWWDAVYNTGHDDSWYSIISKSVVENYNKNKERDNYTYSKIDIKDVYIFVSEKKREIIENNPKYKIEHANIIYIPEEYNCKMNYNLYEFIRKKIQSINNEENLKNPIPKKIIRNDEYNIEARWDEYSWAFCEPVQETKEIIYNPIRNWDTKTILKFFEQNKKEYLADIDKIKDFLMKNSIKIENTNIPIKYPKELITIAITSARAKKNKNIIKIDINDYEKKISRQLSKFWYSTKEIWILDELISFFWLTDIKTFKKDEKIQEICTTWDIEIQQLKWIILEISKIILNRDELNNLKDELE